MTVAELLAPPAPRVVSYGGGVQSTALLVLAARREIDFRTFLFSNVGERAEEPATLDYVRNVAMPFAQEHGIALHELSRRPRRGIYKDRTEDLYDRLTRPGSRSLPIPVRMSNGAPGTRSCTVDFKIVVTSRWLLTHGAAPDNPAEVALGISTDEIERARPGIDPRRPHERLVYPLLDLGLSRQDCARIIASEGLPVPPKSSCWFCPFQRPERWQERKRTQPEIFERACRLEETLNERRAMLGKDPVYLSAAGRPLREAFAHDQGVLFDAYPADCTTGRCFT